MLNHLSEDLESARRAPLHSRRPQKTSEDVFSECTEQLDKRLCGDDHDAELLQCAGVIKVYERI